MIRLYQDISPELLAEMLYQNVRTVGESSYDHNAKQQLEEVTELASWLIFKIKMSADGYKDRQEASVIEFRETAKKCYDKLKAEFEEATDEVEFDD